MKNDFKVRLEQGSQSILTIAGVYSTPQKDSRPAGFSRTGAAVYVLNTLANSSNTEAGSAVLHSFAAMVAPFGVLTKKEKEAINQMAKESGSEKLINSLNKEHKDRKGSTFVAILLKAVGANDRNALGFLAATKLFDHWGVISPAQKSIAIAILAVQTHKTSEGGPVCDIKIIDGPDNQIFYVRDALDLFAAGKNPYPLVEYWDQIYRLFKIYGGKPTPEIMADFATSHKLIGLAVNGAVVPGVSREAIKQNGGKSAPQYGVGALAIPRGKTPPQGYSKAASLQGGDIIAPSANANTAAGALQGSLTGTKAGQDGVSSDAVGVYSKWKKEDKKNEDKGADGGSALIAGLNALKESNPYLYGAMIAFITRYVSDKIEASNPVEYAASLAGIALARLVTGRAEDKADNEGLALAKQVHNATPAEFAKIQTNIKALYANFGVSSKSDAYQLTNQAYAEARINESDLVAMHQIFDIIYGDNGLAIAQKLMNGASKGLEIAKDKTPPAKNRMVEGQKEDHKETLAQMTKQEARARNQAKYANQPQQGSQEEQQEGAQQDNPQEEGAEQGGSQPIAPAATTPTEQTAGVQA